MSTEIDLFAAMRRVNVTSAGRGKATLEISAPDLRFSADENALAGVVAKAIAERIKANMMAGRDPGGTPLPAPSPATLQRRAYRAKQADRGGSAASRYKNGKFRARALKHFEQRFVAPRLGRFKPGTYRTFGMDSGMIAQVSAVAEAGVWRIFFPAPRGNLQAGGFGRGSGTGRDHKRAGRKSGESAVRRVFSRIKAWSAEATAQPEMQRALAELQRVLWQTRLGRFTRALAGAAQNVTELPEGLDHGGAQGSQR